MLGREDEDPARSARDLAPGEFPRTNREWFEDLLIARELDVASAPIFQQAPAPIPDLDWDRVAGMLFGLAIGDALAMPTEGLSGWGRRARYPEPLNYMGKWRGPSDDSQMAFWTLEQIVADGRFDPAATAKILAERCDELIGLGSAGRRFRHRARNGGRWERWATSGSRALGNGAVVRVAPVVVPHLRQPSADLWVDAVLCGRVTHDSKMSAACCVAIVHLIWSCLASREVPPPEWWPTEFARVYRELDSTPARSEDTDARPLVRKFQGSLADLMEGPVVNAFDAGRTVRAVCDPQEGLWGSGPELCETIPSLIFILMKHGDDFARAIEQAVLYTRDNDTIAALVGAVLGALHGREKIPDRWLRGLSGVTRRKDKGQVHHLIRDARARFGPTDVASPKVPEVAGGHGGPN